MDDDFGSASDGGDSDDASGSEDEGEGAGEDHHPAAANGKPKAAVKGTAQPQQELWSDDEEGGEEEGEGGFGNASSDDDEVDSGEPCDRPRDQKAAATGPAVLVMPPVCTCLPNSRCLLSSCRGGWAGRGGQRGWVWQLRGGGGAGGGAAVAGAGPRGCAARCGG